MSKSFLAFILTGIVSSCHQMQVSGDLPFCNVNSLPDGTVGLFFSHNHLIICHSSLVNEDGGIHAGDD